MKYVLMAVLSILVLTGCSSGLDENSPAGVTQAFWIAVTQNGDYKKYMYDKEVPVKIGHHEDDRFDIGATELHDGVYFVDTWLNLTRNGQQVSVPLKTVLVTDKDGGWYVDYWSTSQGVINVILEGASAQIQQEIDSAQQVFELVGADNQKELLENYQANHSARVAAVIKSVIENSQQNSISSKD